MVIVLKSLPANAGNATDVGSVTGSGRSLGRENGSLPQYSCLGNPSGQEESGRSPWGHRGIGQN